ncbi:hypothetical protein WR25_22610 [Diploscapter pachys]|uniref:Uncharacterized protein n=1 Tax=Diploscapter pachys TaxID=2018661 RepID=A0A2A2KI22_9BILA|nr:hypothetical protein WR25_22610 [Diploscapter pachys]
MDAERAEQEGEDRGDIFVAIVHRCAGRRGCQDVAAARFGGHREDAERAVALCFEIDLHADLGLAALCPVFGGEAIALAVVARDQPFAAPRIHTQHLSAHAHSPARSRCIVAIRRRGARGYSAARRSVRRASVVSAATCAAKALRPARVAAAQVRERPSLLALRRLT